MTVKVFIIEKERTREWDGISRDDRERAARELNGRALAALGYEPVKVKKSASKSQERR
ncbi:MAG: hypothetical protein NC223_00870 [Butyrivibrio sp.]|nr:hypothetical protein [Butyrivibrio sp.]